MKLYVPRVFRMKPHVPRGLSMKLDTPLLTDDSRLMPNCVFCCAASTTKHSEFSALRKMCSFHAREKFWAEESCSGRCLGLWDVAQSSASVRPVFYGACVASRTRCRAWSLTDRPCLCYCGIRARTQSYPSTHDATSCFCHPFSKCKVTGRREVLTSAVETIEALCSCVENWTMCICVPSVQIYMQLLGIIVIVAAATRSCYHRCFSTLL
jgi:hypothetical protein